MDDLNIGKEFASNLKKYAEMNLHLENMIENKTDPSIISTGSSAPSARIQPLQKSAKHPEESINILNSSSELESSLSVSQLAKDMNKDNNEMDQEDKENTNGIFDFSFIDDNESVASQSESEMNEVVKKPPKW